MSTATKMKHTPRPWHLHSTGPDDAVRIVDGRDRLIATVAERGDDTETEGNARLILAAPELLEALRRCLRFGDLLPDLADEARSAIDAAEGR